MINIHTLLSVILGFFLFISCSDNSPVEPKTKKDTAAAKQDKVVRQSGKNIVFFGNSITAGYGIQLSQAFPALIQRRIDSLNLPYKVINAGVSGETSSDGSSRIDWILRQPVDIFVLELGGNDGLRGIPVSETVKNLQSIIDKVKAKNSDVKIILAGMQIPPNMGQKYTGEFRLMYPELADKNNIALIPFLLEGVGGEAELNLEDGIHPTAEGHKILAENVWEILAEMLTAA